jgi:hypothetical protein
VRVEDGEVCADEDELDDTGMLFVLRGGIPPGNTGSGGSAGSSSGGNAGNPASGGDSGGGDAATGSGPSTGGDGGQQLCFGWELRCGEHRR